MKVKAMENLYEADGLHKRGEIFEVDEKRAKALGASVEAIEEPGKEIEKGGAGKVEGDQEKNKKEEKKEQGSQEEKKGILGSIKDRMIGQPPQAK